LTSFSPAGLNVFFTADQETLLSRLRVLLVDNDNTILKREFVGALLSYQYDTHILLTLLTGSLLQWVVNGYK